MMQQAMWKDPIVEEIRKIRAEHARMCLDDLHAICEDIRKRQSSAGRKVVLRTPRKPVVQQPSQV
jgi:hypothetical protein